MDLRGMQLVDAVFLLLPTATLQAYVGMKCSSPELTCPWSIRIRRAVVPRRFRRHHLRDAVLRVTGLAREAAVAHLAKLLARAQSAPQRDGREERVSVPRALRARLAHRALLRGEGRVGVFRVFHARGDCFARTKVLAESSGRRRARPRGVAEAGRRRGAAGGFRETNVVARAAVRRPLCVSPHPERHQAVSVRDDLAALHVRGERHGRERAVLVAQQDVPAQKLPLRRSPGRRLPVAALRRASDV